MAKVNVSIAVDDAHLQKLSSIAQKLKGQGLRNSKSLKELGIITGTVEADDVAKLRSIPGIASVETERAVSVPPPSSPVQ